MFCWYVPKHLLSCSYPCGLNKYRASFLSDVLRNPKLTYPRHTVWLQLNRFFPKSKACNQHSFGRQWFYSRLLQILVVNQLSARETCYSAGVPPLLAGAVYPSWEGNPSLPWWVITPHLVVLRQSVYTAWDVRHINISPPIRGSYAKLVSLWTCNKWCEHAQRISGKADIRISWSSGSFI